MVTWLHDDIGLANTAVGKSLSNVGGYTLFEVGATKIMGNTASASTLKAFTHTL